jgi:methyl-accepting chemotaxis protein
MFRSLKVGTKLFLGFGIVIVLTIIMASYALISQSGNSASYTNLLEHSQARLKQIIDTQVSVMDVRRLTTAINAYTGDVNKQNGYKTESETLVKTIKDDLTNYINLTKSDSELDKSEIDTMTKRAESLIATITKYKSDLIDVNINYAIANDKASVVANASAMAPLIADLNNGTEDMVNEENERSNAQEAQIAKRQATSGIMLIIITLAVVLVAICFAYTITISIVSRIHKLIGTVGQLADGDTSISVIVKNKDEIGQLATEFAKMAKDIFAQSETLEQIAAGDYSLDYKPRSDKDVVGIAIVNLLQLNNRAFSDISAGTQEVARGANQIASGAQSLAQGSTEQSAAIEKLSETIAAISEQTKDNSAQAGKAAALSDGVRKNAEKGAIQMDKMIQAVHEINDASNNIQKVIKVIDDIAFQTNILALNAAVEAARAGSAGKGFAVVAEEVRTLAAKSAAAAKDTSSLIEDSLVKAQLGTKIAEETSVSLGEIVDGINESSVIVSNIAVSSEEQYRAIDEINSGIDQVAQVIQQNTATAEESASISAELSNMSLELEGHIQQFKLNSGNGRKLLR